MQPPWTAAYQAPPSTGFSRQEYWSGAPLPSPTTGHIPEKNIIEKDVCTPVFIAALFTITRTWKLSRCLSTDKWINKVWYIYIMEYYLSIKRNGIGLFERNGWTRVCHQRRQRQPTPVLLPGKSHGWRSLVGCSTWVTKSRI